MVQIDGRIPCGKPGGAQDFCLPGGSWGKNGRRRVRAGEIRPSDMLHFNMFATLFAMVNIKKIRYTIGKEAEWV